VIDVAGSAHDDVFHPLMFIVLPVCGGALWGGIFRRARVLLPRPVAATTRVGFRGAGTLPNATYFSPFRKPNPR
jgi:hypothetical protein